jgi:PLP dependent protein
MVRVDSGSSYQAVKDHVDMLARRCGRDPGSISLVAVTKTHPIEQIMTVYQSGCRDFGESRVQEALEKVPLAPDDSRWHLIGTLQGNKVKKVIGRFALIHSVDSLELTKTISLHSISSGIITPILLQVNTSAEATKHGFSPEELMQQISEVFALKGVEVKGLMTMAPFTEDVGVTRQCFSLLRCLRDEVRGWLDTPASFRELSMGMSHDYPIAIEEGATILRIGSAIFIDPKK